jgi:hypothetical protein
LLGVVGIDVPILRLISKVSPKFQMGVGIYIVMLDNNGYIVFHPSLRSEIAKGDFDYKGTSHSIDLDKFEIPIDNEDAFEEFEHQMVDQTTGTRILDNWKREGLRVYKRRTEYVYTKVDHTPFSVAIASPSSFGRYYLDLKDESDAKFKKKLRELLKNDQKFKSIISLYNCTYTHSQLSKKVLEAQNNLDDFCIKYLLVDPDQVLAIESDLAIHDIYYNVYNFSIHTMYPNLVKSSFYASYSGIIFSMPVISYRKKKETNIESETVVATDHGLLSIVTDFKQTVSSFQLDPDSQAFTYTNNLIDKKPMYAFERPRYTRAFELSDSLRTEFMEIDNPMAIFILNQTIKNSLGDISALIPIWYKQVNFK